MPSYETQWSVDMFTGQVSKLSRLDNVARSVYGDHLPDKTFQELSRKHRNPSFRIAPHCLLMPRKCCCLKVDGVKSCDPKKWSSSCEPEMVITSVRVVDQDHRGRYKGENLTNQDMDEIERKLKERKEREVHYDDD